MAHRFLLVGNPSAQSGRGLGRIDAVLRIMRDYGLEVRFLRTRPEGRTPAMVAEAIDGSSCDVVVYVGGDGTFADVAKGVLQAERDVAMGMMPAGTANDQGKSFGIGSTDDEVEANVGVLLADHRIAMDVGRVVKLREDGTEAAQELWFDNMGFGLAPAILARRNLDRDRVGQVPVLREIYRDQAVYAGAIVQEFLRSWVEPVKFDAEIDLGEEVVVVRGLTDIVVNNTPMYGGEWVPVTTAVANDGLLDLSTLVGRRELVSKLVLDHKLLPLWGDDIHALGLELSRSLTAARFEITLLQPRGGDVPAQIDGEEWGAGTHFRVDVLPGRLPLVVREDFEPPWAAR